MSVMQRIQELSGEAGDPFTGPQFSIADPEASNEMDSLLQAQAIPGQSLTQDPENKLPFEQPPEFVKLQDFMEALFLQVTEEDKLPPVLDGLRQGMPVENLAQEMLEQAFRQGKITPDLLMLAIEPTIYMLIALASYAGIEPVLYPEESMEDDGDDKAQMFRQAANGLLADVEEEDKADGIQIEDIEAPAEGVPKGLMQRVAEVVDKPVDKPEENML